MTYSYRWGSCVLGLASAMVLGCTGKLSDSGGAAGSPGDANGGSGGTAGHASHAAGAADPEGGSGAESTGNGGSGAESTGNGGSGGSGAETAGSGGGTDYTAELPLCDAEPLTWTSERIGKVVSDGCGRSLLALTSGKKLDLVMMYTFGNMVSYSGKPGGNWAEVYGKYIEGDGGISDNPVSGLRRNSAGRLGLMVDLRWDGSSLVVLSEASNDWVLGRLPKGIGTELGTLPIAFDFRGEIPEVAVVTGGDTSSATVLYPINIATGDFGTRALGSGDRVAFLGVATKAGGFDIAPVYREWTGSGWSKEALPMTSNEASTALVRVPQVLGGSTATAEEPVVLFQRDEAFMALQRDASGAWQATQVLDHPCLAPDVVRDEQGQLHIACQVVIEDVRHLIYLRPSQQGWCAIPVEQDEPAEPTIRLDESGRVVIGWVQSKPSGEENRECSIRLTVGEP